MGEEEKELQVSEQGSNSPSLTTWMKKDRNRRLTGSVSRRNFNIQTEKTEEKDVKDEETEVKKEEKEVLKDEKEIKNEGKEVKVAKKEEKYVKDEVTASKKEEKEVINEKKDVKEVKEVKKDEKEVKKDEKEVKKVQNEEKEVEEEEKEFQVSEQGSNSPSLTTWMKKDRNRRLTGSVSRRNVNIQTEKTREKRSKWPKKRKNMSKMR